MKKIIIVADHHYYEDEEGTVFVPSVYGYNYWKRYLNVFETIVVLARGRKGENFDKEKMIVASGPNVQFEFVRDFSGVQQLACHYLEIKRTISRSLSSADAVIIRAPSPLSRLAVNYCLKEGKRFLIELAADPAENYDKVPFSNLVKRLMKKNCKKACLYANGVSYVTKYSLQRNYPSHAQIYGESNTHFECSCANANLDNKVFMRKKDYSQGIVPRLIHVANVIDGEAKGHYVALDIISHLKKWDILAELVFVGDGPEIPRLVAKSKELDVFEQIQFLGRISNESALYAAYHTADFFVLPSKTEGTPRSLLEAMACGLVCLASNVGGIPEVLPKDYLFNWDDSEAFGEKIASLAATSAILSDIGAANREIAKEYEDTHLQLIRDGFYRKLSNII